MATPEEQFSESVNSLSNDLNSLRRGSIADLSSSIGSTASEIKDAGSSIKQTADNLSNHNDNFKRASDVTKKGMDRLGSDLDNITKTTSKVAKDLNDTVKQTTSLTSNLLPQLSQTNFKLVESFNRLTTSVSDPKLLGPLSDAIGDMVDTVNRVGNIKVSADVSEKMTRQAGEAIDAVRKSVEELLISPDEVEKEDILLLAKYVRESNESLINTQRKNSVELKDSLVSDLENNRKKLLIDQQRLELEKFKQAPDEAALKKQRELEERNKAYEERFKKVIEAPGIKQTGGLATDLLFQASGLGVLGKTIESFFGKSLFELGQGAYKAVYSKISSATQKPETVDETKEYNKVISDIGNSLEKMSVNQDRSIDVTTKNQLDYLAKQAELYEGQNNRVTEYIEKVTELISSIGNRSTDLADEIESTSDRQIEELKSVSDEVKKSSDKQVETAKISTMTQIKSSDDLNNELIAALSDQHDESYTLEKKSYAELDKLEDKSGKSASSGLFGDALSIGGPLGKVGDTLVKMGPTLLAAAGAAAGLKYFWDQANEEAKKTAQAIAASQESKAAADITQKRLEAKYKVTDVSGLSLENRLIERKDIHVKKFEEFTPEERQKELKALRVKEASMYTDLHRYDQLRGSWEGLKVASEDIISGRSDSEKRAIWGYASDKERIEAAAEYSKIQERIKQFQKEDQLLSINEARMKEASSAPTSRTIDQVDIAREAAKSAPPPIVNVAPNNTNYNAPLTTNIKAVPGFVDNGSINIMNHMGE